MGNLFRKYSEVLYNHRSSNPLRQFSGWQVFLKHGWDTATFVTNYIPFILFPILYIIWKFKTKVPIVRASEMDFTTGLDQIEADTCVVQNWWRMIVSADLNP